MADFHAQLCSDVDYVIYPDKDPEVSRQEYMDAKNASQIALEAQQQVMMMNSTSCLCCCCGSQGAYQSLSACSSTYGSATYEAVRCCEHGHGGRHQQYPPGGASDSGYGRSLGGHRAPSLSSCYTPSATHSDTYYESVQLRSAVGVRPTLSRQFLGHEHHQLTSRRLSAAYPCSASANASAHYGVTGSCSVGGCGGRASSDTYEVIQPPSCHGLARNLRNKAQSSDNLLDKDIQPVRTISNFVVCSLQRSESK